MLFVIFKGRLKWFNKNGVKTLAIIWECESMTMSLNNRL
jgi:hypothetical protein